jgi:organic hydroperoxide reductase OsmC/OhrA
MPDPHTLERFISMVEQNLHAEAVAAFYAPDVRVHENQAPARVGRELHVARERAIFARADRVRSTCVRPALASGDTVVLRWIFEFDWKDGTRTRMEELAYQRWDGEQIVEETFFYDPAQRTPRAPAGAAPAPADAGKKQAIHHATIEWARGSDPFVDNRYSRAHVWRFDGGATVAASSSPHVVREPFSDPRNVDPEEALVASISSCHMLWFLGLAAERGFRVERYEDHAEGRMARNEHGKEWVSDVVLRPRVVFGGERTPTGEEVDALHHSAHAECYIANSVRTRVVIEARWERAE